MKEVFAQPEPARKFEMMNWNIRKVSENIIIKADKSLNFIPQIPIKSKTRDTW